MCKFKSGLGGIPAAVFRSFSRLYPDRESHANPLQNLHSTLWKIDNRLNTRKYGTR